MGASSSIRSREDQELTPMGRSYTAQSHLARLNSQYSVPHTSATPPISAG